MSPDLAVKILEKVADDEPVFILRGIDRMTPKTIRQWAENAAGIGATAEKVQGARDRAVEIERWQQETGRMKCPD